MILIIIVDRLFQNIVPLRKTKIGKPSPKICLEIMGSKKNPKKQKTITKKTNSENTWGQFPRIQGDQRIEFNIWSSLFSLTGCSGSRSREVGRAVVRIRVEVDQSWYRTLERKGTF